MTVPGLLMAFRGACAPAMFVLACFGFSGPLLAGMLAAGFLSDVLNARLARHSTPTPGQRRADRLVDTAFYASAAAAMAVAVPGAFDGAGLLLAALIAIHVSRATFEVAKYGRVAPSHVWSAKTAGVLLAVAMGWLAG